MDRYQEKEKNPEGFTLVELAIVMVIIGLLIGGIIKGQALLENARISATIAQIQGYEAAVTGFRDKYDGLPGDMSTGQDKIPNCCQIANIADDNGIVGEAMVAPGAAFLVSQASSAPGNGPMSFETQLFWEHLSRADFITGVGNLNHAAPSPGNSHPAGKIGGAIHVTYAPVAPAALANAMTGHYFVFRNFIQQNLDTLPNIGGQIASPHLAAKIDRKYDDGSLMTGYMIAFGINFGPGFCSTDETNNSANSCNLAFRMPF